MTNETRKRIIAYKKALPELRERVAAVALLLAMSVSMLASASFAWITLSVAPEVNEIQTSLAANGNLEIALATGKTAPMESQVGDSNAAEGQSVTAANITWGNLVNLSDPSYGLDNLTLRPAQLNTAALLTNPLYGAEYSTDGRIIQLNSSFGYTMWNPPAGDKPGYFGVSEGYGVRAISSTKIEAVGAEATYTRMLQEARDANGSAATTYAALSTKSDQMQSLATMMGLYMTARMNPSNATLSNPECKVADIQNLRDMYVGFLEAFDQEAEAMAALANLQLFLRHGDGNYTPYTKETIYSSTTDGLKAAGIQISNLDQFIKDRGVILSDKEKLDVICSSGGTLKWTDSGLNGIVNNLVDVGKCTIGANNTPISSIGASNAASYLSGTQEARITNGILYRFEERTGGNIEVKNLKISATVERKGITIPASVKANVQTTAPRDYNLFSNDLAYAESLNDGTYEGGIAVAQDTYGLAIDLWVRTNAMGSYLTLEGNVLTESKEVNVTTKDPNGNTVNVYSFTQSITDEEGNTLPNEIEVYKVNGKWYDAYSHRELTEEELDNAEPTPKVEEIEVVVGYEGENRIWNQNSTMISTDATTQGSGSCYVYYADTPEDQARSLKLLESYKVAFVNAAGKRMATAVMDTERYYAESGRVIVPLVLDTSDSINLGEDAWGETTYAITALDHNAATRITAFVYLDGTKLTNKDVLSAAEIQGRLNIQFGSSQELMPISNEDLAAKELRVSAAVDNTQFDWDTATEPMTTNVTVNVDGDNPNNVTAFFLREISANQGAREEVMTFTKDNEGKWKSSYTFKTPGNYILRSVRLDGVDYDLQEPQRVVVKGFTVASLSCSAATENNVNIMTAASESAVPLTLKFATNDPKKLPKTVQGRYIRVEDGSAVNVNFTYNTNDGSWSGEARFLSSGDYEMQYLVLDGEYHNLAESFWQTATVTLGMRVAVYTTSPHTFKYVPSEMADNEKLLQMEVKILDNNGGELRGLSNVKLTYGMKGSGVKKMDTDLTWDGSSYVGEFTTSGPGIWQFSKVTVGANTLTTATTSPTFTIQSPEPPEYVAHRTETYQYRPNNGATMNVSITNSSAAAVQAYIIKSGTAEGAWVDGVISDETITDSGKTANNWNFLVPKDANGYQDGNWKLTQLRLWDVFDQDGTAYTEEAPLEIDVSAKNIVSKVVNRITVTFPEGLSKDFGKDNSGNVTSVFMDDTHSISGLSVTIKDFENNQTTKIENVKLTFEFENGSSVKYGGYSSPQLNNGTTGAKITVGLTPDSSGTVFSQGEDAPILFAGSYTTTLSYTLNGTTVTLSGDKLPAGAPKYSVSSVAPTVTIKDRTNYEGSSTNGNTVTVAYGHSTETACGVTYHNYSQASVTLALSGYGKADEAKLTFAESNGGDVRLYQNKEDADNKRVNNFSWTGDGDCLRWVGYWDSQTGTDRATAAGTIKAEKLVLTKNGMDFEVDIDDITIINPTPPS